MNRLEQLQKQLAAKERGQFWFKVGLLFLALIGIIFLVGFSLDGWGQPIPAILETLPVICLAMCGGCAVAFLQIGEYTFFHFLKKLFFVKTK